MLRQAISPIPNYIYPEVTDNLPTNQASLLIHSIQLDLLQRLFVISYKHYLHLSFIGTFAYWLSCLEFTYLKKTCSHPMLCEIIVSLLGGSSTLVESTMTNLQICSMSFKMLTKVVMRLSH